MPKHRYPKTFYYAENTSAVSFKATPPGTPNVRRLIEGRKEAFENPVPKYQLKPKKLVLADWRARKWSLEKIKAVQQKLKQMMTEDEHPEARFEFYRWSNGNCIPLNVDNLSCLQEYDTRKSMMPTQNSHIKEAASKVGLSPNKVFVLDSYNLDCLLQDNFNLEHILYTSDFDDVPHALQMKGHLYAMTPPPERLIHAYGESETDDKKYQTFKNIFRECSFEIILRKILYMDDTFLKMLLEEDFLGLLSNTEEIRLRYNHRISFGDIWNVLQHTQNLQCLDVGNFRSLSETSEVILPNFLNLEKIRLSSENIPPEMLLKLLEHAPNLKHLHLYSVKALNETFEAILSNFLNLEEIDLFDCDILPETFLKFLEHARNLKHLNLNSIKSLNETFEANFPNCPNLEEITVASREISPETLFKLLQAAPNLKRLNLRYCQDPNKAFATISSNFPNIEELNLLRAKIHLKTLSSLSQHLPNFKKLNLKDCKILNNLSSEEIPPNFSNLKALHLRTSEFSPEDIFELLQHVPNLEELDLSETTICLKTLSSLSQHLPNLKKLNLNGCSVLNHVSSEETPPNFPNLKVLDFSVNMNIRTSQPHTRSSSVNRIQRIFKEETSDKLNELFLFDLISFLAKAPNLEKLILPIFFRRYIALDSLLQKIPEVEFVSSFERNLKEALLVSPVPEIIHTPDQKELNIGEGLEDLFEIPLSEKTSDSDGFDASKVSKARSKGRTRRVRVDAETRLGDDTLKADQIFYSVDSTPPPHVSLFRLEIYDQLYVNPEVSSPQNAFVLKQTDDLHLESCDIQICSEDVYTTAQTLNEETEGTYYYGKQTLTLTDEWQPIASLSPNEALTHCHISPQDGSVEIQYSTVYNQYFIKSLSGMQTIDFDFAVHVPPPPTEPLPPDIQARVDYYLSFGSGALELDMKNPTGEDYLKAIIHQKKGACRHRAIAFKYEMDQKHEREFLCRLPVNDCHALLELLVNGQWYTLNLGGYPAKLTIDDSNRPSIPGALQKPHSTHVIFDGQSFRPDLFKLYLNDFATWERGYENPKSALEYIAHCLKPDPQKRLIECQSEDELHALRAMLQLHATRPVFYINSPDDLICAAPYLTRNQDNQGIIHEGPGGPLYAFLMNHPDGTLIINYAFKAADMVRFNTLLDKEPSIDGVPLPKKIKIIGLMNTNDPDCYQGSDFYSRFEGNIETCQITRAMVLAKEPRLAEAHAALSESKPGVSAQEPLRINLFHASDWRERLLGHWVLDGKNLYFQEGGLAQLQPGQPIEIINGLWESPSFRQFWIDIQSVGVPHPAGAQNGVKTPVFLFEDNAIEQSEGYNWQALLSHLALKTDKAVDAVFCNPTLLPECFNRHKIEEGLFHKEPGWIEQARETGVLSLHLTRSLNEDEWAMLLTEAQRHGVEVQVSFAPGIEVPEVFNDFFQIPEPQNAMRIDWRSQTVNQITTQAIISTDISTTVQQLTCDKEDWLVFDISECEPSDLLVETQAKFDEAHCHFYFSEKKRLLFKALQENKNIILKGHFSKTLKDCLVPFLDEREQNSDASGRLILVTNHEKDFNDRRMRSYHDVQDSEKIEILLGPHNENQAYLEYLRDYFEKESLAKLQARLRYLKTQATADGRLEDLNSDNAWIGLRTLPKQTESMDTFDFETSEQEAHDFMQNRFNSVNQAFQKSPCVVLSGPSGGGKTTLAERMAQYIGEEQLKAWAKDHRGEHHKILFIDEANLAHNDWTQLEGLFQQPPVILIGGKPYPLTPQHKVIFAGNPTSYGDERKLPRLFEQHGSALYFQPLPKTVLYENILKPIFENTSLSSEALEAICGHILTIYDFIKPLSQHEVLISPRELQAIALLIQAAAVTQKDEYDASGSAPSIDETTIKRIAWQYAKPWVPKAHQYAFDKAFKPDILPDERIEKRNDFIITASRQALVQQMDEWLSLRRWRIAQNEQLNDAQRYGGLGGFVIEGAPGIGKSDIVIQNLIFHGFREVHDMEQTAEGDIFYRIPASLSLSEKETRLRKAFHEGAVVIMDEMNSFPMERFMNSLLMGKTPEGERPRNPGFFIIGTQNPASMAGRHVASNALGHRMNQTHLTLYEEQELRIILKEKGLDTEQAEAMAKAFLTQCQYAIQNHLKPEPTFRNLLVQAEYHLLRTQQTHAQATEMGSTYSNGKRHTVFGEKRAFSPESQQEDTSPEHKRHQS